MFKFIIPGYYLFYSRLKSKIEKVSWFIIYIIPIYILGLFYTSSDYFIFTMIFILAILIFNSIYEIGYIENDTKTILNEKSPTLRLKEKDYNLFKEKYFIIILFKILVSSSLLFLVYILSDRFLFNIYLEQFLLLLFIVRILFYMHNQIRSRVNIVTFFTLAIMKYSAPLFLILPLDSLFPVWIISFFLFPLLRTLEHSTKKKYYLIQWSNFVGNHDSFRVKYYSIMLIITLIINYFYSDNTLYVVLLLFMYFLIFRISSYFLVKNKLYKRYNTVSLKKEDKC